MTSERTCHFTGDNAWKCGTHCTCQHFNWNNKGQAAMTSELRPADSPWECFRDEAYYDMWCLRRENWRTFGQGFHLMRGEEAEALRDLLNEQAAELDQLRFELEAANEVVAEQLEIRQRNEAELAKFKALCVMLSGALKEIRRNHPAKSHTAITADEALRQYKEARDV